MKLRTLNWLLRRIGLVLVVQTGDAGEPTRIRFQRSSTYDRLPRDNKFIK